MDKKNTFLGIALLIAAIASLFLSMKYAPQRPASPAAVRRAVVEQGGAAPAPSAPALQSAGPEAAFATPGADPAGATITVLENGFIQVRFTDFGGAVRDVALKRRLPNGSYQYPTSRRESLPFVFNELHADPMLAVVGFPGLDSGTRFELVSKSANEVVYRAVLDRRLEVTRRYVLPPDAGDSTDPYQFRAETTFRNLTGETAAPMRISMALGTAPFDILDNGRYLTTGYSDGKSQSFILRSKLEASSGMFGLGAHDASSSVESPGPIVWGTVTNQFFGSIFTPDNPGAGLVTRRVRLARELPETDSHAYSLVGSILLDVPAIAPNGTASLGGSLYVGPKEYRRLSNSEVFKADQDRVMQFGFFKYFSALLITLMTWIHSFIPNWGLAIVFTTLTLKTILLPLTLAASRSARRMQKIQPQMKVIAEKFKDNPQKKNAATMELFKEHKVNPAGGCLPLLITMPFFFGFFTMLQSTAELRFAPFLWAYDLSMPDTVGHLLGIPVNILPILLGITSFAQMRLTPQPTVDNAQAKMMMFSPIIMLVFCYSFSCALSLYSTTNGIFSIVQQLAINRMKDDGDPATAKAAAGGTRPGAQMKNVTPGKKR